MGIIFGNASDVVNENANMILCVSAKLIEEEKLEEALFVFDFLNNYLLSNGVKKLSLNDFILWSTYKTIGGINKENKSVYIIGFDDGTVKIGVSKEPTIRAKIVSHQSGRNLKEIAITKPLKNSFAYEKTLHEFFNKKRLNGEFFNEDFDECLSVAKKFGLEFEIAFLQE